jgi:hypothetical protein
MTHEVNPFMHSTVSSSGSFSVCEKRFNSLKLLAGAAVHTQSVICYIIIISSQSTIISLIVEGGIERYYSDLQGALLRNSEVAALFSCPFPYRTQVCMED